MQRAFALRILSVTFLAQLLSPAVSWTEPAEAAGPAAVVTAPSGLVLRERPDAQSKSLGLMRTGTKVQVLWFRREEVTIGGIAGRWVQVSHEGKTGWCFGGYLDASAGLEPAFKKRLASSLWGPVHGWGMYTRFRADGTFHGHFQGEGAGEVLGLYTVISPSRIRLKSIPGERGDDARPDGFDSECALERDSDSVFKEWYLDCGSVRHYDQNSNVAAGMKRSIGDVPAVTMGARSGVTTARVRVRSAPNTAAKELECGGYGTEPVPYAESGTKLAVYARTESKEKLQSYNNYWYYVNVQCFVLPVHGWVFAEFVKLD